MSSLLFGTHRFRNTAAHYSYRQMIVGDYDIPTGLRAVTGDTSLCLPYDIRKWGLDPSRPWLSLAFLVACHTKHFNERELAIRQAAWAAIPLMQWPALVAKAAELVAEFREQINQPTLDMSLSRKWLTSLLYALRDCILYVQTPTFPADQDGCLADAPESLARLIRAVERARASELSSSEGITFANEASAIVAPFVDLYDGMDACRNALTELRASCLQPWRNLLFPLAGLLDAETLLAGDILMSPEDTDACLMVSITSRVPSPHSFEFHNEETGKPVNIIGVPSQWNLADKLFVGYFDTTVAEMILLRGTARTSSGRKLMEYLTQHISPQALAKRCYAIVRAYFEGNPDFFSSPYELSEAQVRCELSLFGTFCNMLSRARYIQLTDQLPGDQQSARLAEQAGLGDVFQNILSLMQREDVPKAELRNIARRFLAVLTEVKKDLLA